MKELEIYMHYLLQVPLTIKKSFQSMSGIVTMIAGVLVGLSGIQKSIIVLAVVFHLDLITGCIASWIEHKNSGEKSQSKAYFFESSKMRLSVVKAVSYIMLILCSYFLGVLFFDMPISLIYSTKSFSPAELTAGACIAIEIWSNLENLKRAGFDVIGKFTGVVKQLWRIKDTVTTGGGNEQA